MTASRTEFRLGVVASAVLALAGCGGGGSPTATTAPTAASLSGQSYKGPTAGATVCAYAIDNAAAGKKGAQVAAQTGSTPTVANGCVVTANDGTYEFVLPAGTSGDLIIESTGGTYCSDESVFDGTACAGGGTPIAMGAASLRTVVAAPATGSVANAPLTLLTTAAADSAANLTASTFNAAYGTVAANFGLSDTSPSASPAGDVLKSTLAMLTDYVGGDTSLFAQVLAGISDGSLKVEGGDLAAAAAFSCSALAASDVSTGGMQAHALRGGCIDDADGLTSWDFGFFIDGGMAALLENGTSTGFYHEQRFNGACAAGDAREHLGSGLAGITVTGGGTQVLPASLSADGTHAQSGSATRLTIVLASDPSVSKTAAGTYRHLFCRTEAAPVDTVNFKGFFTSIDSPVRDGFLSRIDPSNEFTAWTD